MIMKYVLSLAKMHISLNLKQNKKNHLPATCMKTFLKINKLQYYKQKKLHSPGSLDVLFFMQETKMDITPNTATTSMTHVIADIRIKLFLSRRNEVSFVLSEVFFVVVVNLVIAVLITIFVVDFNTVTIFFID